jgi:hypothetical protein
VCAQCASVRPIQPFYLTKREAPYKGYLASAAWGLILCVEMGDAGPGDRAWRRRQVPTPNLRSMRGTVRRVKSLPLRHILLHLLDPIDKAQIIRYLLAPSPYRIESVRIGLFGFRLVIIRIAFDAVLDPEQ